MPTFLQFAQAEAPRLWHGQHLKRSLTKAATFAAFSDHQTREISDYKPSHIHSFFDSLQASRGLSDSTVNRYAAMLTKVFAQAVKEELITHVPKFTWRRTEQSARPLYFTPEQLEAMCAYFHDEHPQWWMRHMITIGSQTGMRRGEILSIKRGLITNDNDGNLWLHLPLTKNGSERFVPLNKQVMSAIEALDYDVSKHFDEHAFYRSWDHMRHKVLGNHRGYVFHTLRHTAATRLANEHKANTAVIGMLLGHRCDTTTRKYIKAQPAALQLLARQLQA